MVPGKLVPGKMVPEKIVPGKMVAGKMVPRKMVLGKNGPRKMAPENWSLGNSQSKNRGVGVKHRGMCVEYWDVIKLWKLKTRQHTQNSETNPKHGNKKSWGERRASWCVCVECSDVINLWKPKTRQKIFLDSFSVLQFGAYPGSWCKRQKSFCVCSGINW